MGFLARLLTVYGEQHPDVEIDIFEAAPADHILAVRQFRLDLAFVVGTPPLSDCDSAEFWTERVHVVLPQTHPLAAHREIIWRDLRGETFILSERGLGLEVSNFLVKHLGDLGAPPCIEWHSVGRDNLMQLVALGRGVTLTSAATVAMRFPGIIYRPLHRETLPFCAVWSPQNDNPAFRRFLSLARTLATRTGKCSCPNSISKSPRLGMSASLPQPSDARSQSPDPSP